MDASHGRRCAGAVVDLVVVVANHQIVIVHIIKFLLIGVVSLLALPPSMLATVTEAAMPLVLLLRLLLPPWVGILVIWLLSRR